MVAVLASIRVRRGKPAAVEAAVLVNLFKALYSHFHLLDSPYTHPLKMSRLIFKPMHKGISQHVDTPGTQPLGSAD